MKNGVRIKSITILDKENPITKTFVEDDNEKYETFIEDGHECYIKNGVKYIKNPFSKIKR